MVITDGQCQKSLAESYIGAALSTLKTGLPAEQLPASYKHFKSAILSSPDGATAHNQANLSLRLSMGLVCFELDILEEAFNHLFIAAGMMVKTANPAELAMIISLLGEVYRRKGDTQQAADAWRLALQIFPKENDYSKKACNFEMVQKILYTSDIGKKIYWNSRARDLHETYGNNNGTADVLESLLKELKPQRLLEIGCGDGRHFSMFTALNIPDVVGQDINEASIQLARCRGYQTIKLLCAPIQALESSNNTHFDLVISNRVLQHISYDEIDDVIASICRIGKIIYLNEITQAEMIYLRQDHPAFYIFLHDYESLFRRQDFVATKKIITNGQVHYLFQAGQVDLLEAYYRKTLEKEPNNTRAIHCLGVLCCQQNRFDEGIALIEDSIRRESNDSIYYSNLGNALYASKKLDRAKEAFESALKLNPDNTDAQSGLGLICLDLGKSQDAAAIFRHITAIKPRFAMAHNNLGNALWYSGDAKAALRSFQEAIAIDSTFADAYENIGNIMWDTNQPGEALIFYEKAMRLNPTDPELLKTVARRLGEIGDIHGAKEIYDVALGIKNVVAWRISKATLLPPICESAKEIAYWRNEFETNVDHLLREKVCLDNHIEDLAPSFYLAYHGKEDKLLQEKLARLYLGAGGAAITTEHKPVRNIASPSHRLRIGFVSTFFRDHTIGKLNRGVIANLCRKKFEVVVFAIGPNRSHSDEVASFIREHSDRYIEVPKKLAAVQHAVASENIDILYFTDIGMEPLTYLLAFSRLAPIQCATWGHPVTTGIPTIDYFISSKDLELTDGDNHYSEKLVALNSSPVYYYRPEKLQAEVTRADFSLPEEAHLYVCPQTLFKLHPDFDLALASILNRDPLANIVLIRSLHQNWVDSLVNRFKLTMPEVAHRIIFVPQQSYTRFLGLLSVSNVMLDTFYFGGGNTTYEALSVGTPVVTLPTGLLKGRITYAIYKRMGMMSCVANSVEDYVNIALHIGMDDDYRMAVRADIASRSDSIYEDMDFVKELEQFFILANSPT